MIKKYKIEFYNHDSGNVEHIHVITTDTKEEVEEAFSKSCKEEGRTVDLINAERVER